MANDNRPDAVGIIVIAASGGLLGGLAFLAVSHGALFSMNWCAGSIM